jgi:hypothetical protein
VRLVLVVVAAVIVLSGSAHTGLAETGNSGAAHQCQKGGWEQLQRSDGSPFANQGACVSYAAHAGELQPIPSPTPPPPLSPMIRVEQYTVTTALGGCSVNIIAEGLAPDTPYWFRIQATGIDFVRATRSDAFGVEDSAFTGGGLDPVFTYYADSALSIIVVGTTEPFQCAPVGEM